MGLNQMEGRGWIGSRGRTELVGEEGGWIGLRGWG